MTLDRSFEDFERDMRLRGFEAVIEKQWPPHAVVDTHVHPFAARQRRR
jgi:hypothetical protein